MGASIQSGASQLVNLLGSVDDQHPERRERIKANMDFVYFSPAVTIWKFRFCYNISTCSHGGICLFPLQLWPFENLGSVITFLHAVMVEYVYREY